MFLTNIFGEQCELYWVPLPYFKTWEWKCPIRPDMPTMTYCFGRIKQRKDNRYDWWVRTEDAFGIFKFAGVDKTQGVCDTWDEAMMMVVYYTKLYNLQGISSENV